jgi:Phosphotransferase enzyme family
MSAANEALWQIYELVCGERWFAQKHLSPSDMEIRDNLIFDGLNGHRYEWLLFGVGRDAKVYSVVTGVGANGEVTLASPTYLLEKIRQHKSLPTTQGGVLRFSEQQQDFEPLEYQALEAGNSSNSLFVTSVGEQACVAKFYRKMDGAGTREQQTLGLMQATGFTPQIFASVEYHPQNSDEQSESTIICLFLEFISGTPAFEPFQRAIRSAFTQSQGGSGLDQLIDKDPYILPELCKGLGKGIAGFHRSALSLYGLQPEQPRLILSACFEALQKRWARVKDLMKTIDHDAIVGSGADNLAVEALLDKLVNLGGVPPYDLMACYSHGDLHLSHIIVEGASLRCRIIDPAHELGQSATPDHSAHDVFQVRRGFEYFVFDEIATLFATQRGCTREEASERLANSADAEAQPYMRFASAWSQRVFSCLVETYLSVVPDRLSRPVKDPRWQTVFYLDRLLHELEYNIVYGRRFFLNADFAFLKIFLRGAGYKLEAQLSA